MNSLSSTEGLSRLYKRLDLRILFIVLSLAILFSATSLAQEATIVGTVMDPTGAAVANATITITNTDTGIARTIATGGDGQYVAPDLHIGHYLIRAQAAGFKAGERKDLVLQVGDRTRVDFSLQIGNAQETVTVEANAVAVQTDSGEVSSMVTANKSATFRPTGGRSITFFR